MNARPFCGLDAQAQIAPRMCSVNEFIDQSLFVRSALQKTLMCHAA